ncbi:type I-A CRISPR-associated protein Cas4/Csa1 [Heliorestis acidaminivorans]|uniref:Type I-A CRISPR-associated protein Cas4/Csa1 n=1 Tax=Heliorestis acidaminivorans TaxID=553427 RepID=A0A6I0EX13_9FIRM|nr:type I-A CRISPR-associated protein Cas4/Csa1 [Heliorestis acidaminivorans]KAB2952697.1 type I-A CRISPR-associated protein Cas4/Csa1 [Heliorestis acidaminivorans]
MFFLSSEEQKKLLRYYLPKARMEGVAEELRGWNWNQAPLSPVYDTTLGVYEVAGAYCDSARDLYLRRVEKIYQPPNEAMLRGKIFHAIVARIIVNTKKLIYLYGVSAHGKIIDELNKIQLTDVINESFQKSIEALTEKEQEEIRKKGNLLLEFERDRIKARLQETLVKQPYIGEDSLAALTVPIVVEHKLDGSFLGLSRHLSTDAFHSGESMIVDLKFGEPRKFHRLTTTGYALVMEAMYEYPVNVGCLVYVSFVNNRILIHRDIHIISDELRQWFIESRDEKARLIEEEIDPGRASACSHTCPYKGHCQ